MKDNLMLVFIISVVSTIMGFLLGMIVEKIKNLYYTMTREEEIEKAFDELFNSSYYVKTYKMGFEVGAAWADRNPKSPWISVNEKLPPIEKNNLSIKVIVVSTKGKIDFSRYDYDMKGWISPVLDIEFTHWMQLPKLPE